MSETLTGGPTGPGSPLSPYRHGRGLDSTKCNQMQQIKKKTYSYAVNKVCIYACFTEKQPALTFRPVSPPRGRRFPSGPITNPGSPFSP